MNIKETVARDFHNNINKEEIFTLIKLTLEIKLSLMQNVKYMFFFVRFGEIFKSQSAKIDIH